MGIYFDVFDRLILNHKDVFSFTGRSRAVRARPVQRTAVVRLFPAGERAPFAEAVGLDSYVGFSAHRPSNDLISPTI